MANESTPRRDIVVIGGSAGSLEPLTTLVSELPGDLAASLLVVVHVASDGPSVLPKILMSAGPLPAMHPADGQRIEPGVIYVAPSDHHLLVEDGQVKVTRGPRENRHRPAIDPLFRTAARSYGSRVVGIVLSGLLDDGAAGLMAIRMRGGLAVVQDPAEASYPEMPARALQYSGADCAMPAKDMAKLLVELSQEQSFRKFSRVEGSVPKGKVKDRADLEGSGNKEKEGTPSPFACPECHGVLWEVQEGELLRFRCRVGHGYTETALRAAMSEATENALWAAMRALEEKAALMRRMASRSALRLASAYEEDAQAYDKHAESIRGILGESQKAA
jgi:two-component system, chemotaxis family, protein-glutamate methylesterase/glutaminase